MAAPSDDSPPAGPKIQGLKYLDRLLPLFDRLHDVGCQRDRAGNRKLHFDHYCALILLFLLNPVLRSFRALQQASLLEQVRRKVGCSRTSLGSLSEAVEILEPQRLEAIIAELWAEARPSRGVGKGYVRQVLTAVDGSVVKTLASLAEAAYLRDKNGNTHCGWRFHTQFEIDRQLPVGGGGGILYFLILPLFSLHRGGGGGARARARLPTLLIHEEGRKEDRGHLRRSNSAVRPTRSMS